MHITLLQMLESLCLHRGMHICVHDLSGILQYPTLELPEKYCIHSTDFCELAKKTALGFRVCIQCKIRSIHKAEMMQQTITGYCSYGLYNIAAPVFIGNRIGCIVYISNLTKNYEKLYHSIDVLCRLTGVSVHKMHQEISKTEYVTDVQPYTNIAYLVADYIQHLYENRSKHQRTQNMHWAVQALLRDVERSISVDHTLKNAAQVYYINEQYLGRLFKQQVGMSYHEYLNQRRMEYATRQLLEFPKKSISDVALDCGFQTLTYFNRLFLKYHGVSPSQYRKTIGESRMEK